MSVLVVGHAHAGGLDVLGSKVMEHAFRHHDGAVADAQQAALDDGGEGQLDDLVDGDGGLVEHLRDDRHRGVRGLADTQGQVAGAAAHSTDEQPVAGGAGILIHGAGNVRALVFGGVEAEGRGVVRQREVIVDRLGDVDVGDGILLVLQELRDAVGRGGGVVAADGHQQLDVVVREQGQVEILLEILVRGLEAAHLKIGAPAVEVGVSLEKVEVLGARAGAEEAAVAAVEADDTITAGQEGLGHGAHDGVHARSRAAAAKNNDGIFHCVTITN